MALLSRRQIETVGGQPVYAEFHAENYRNGNTVRTRAWARIDFGGLIIYNNRVKVRITIDGTKALDQTLKGNTKGLLKTYDSSWSSYVDKSHAAAGSVPIKYEIWDEQNTSWINYTYNGTLSYSAPPRPATPTLSIDSTTRNSITINWSTNMNVNAINYKIDDGGWVGAKSASGSNGKYTVSGLQPGRQYKIRFDVRSSASNEWTSVARDIYGTTKNVSTISNLKLVPVHGSSSSLYLTFSSSQTGGTTTVEYQRPGNTTWHKTTGGTVGSLSPSTPYTVNLRAKNSSGEINTYSVKATTHPQPGGTSSLVAVGKTGIRVSTSSLSSVNKTEYSLGGAAWVTFSGSATISGLTPGKTYSTVVRLSNTTTGVSTQLSAQSVKLSSLAVAVASKISSSNILRNKATLSVPFDDLIDKYSYIIEGSSEVTKNFSGGSFNLTVPEGSSNFTSGTKYKISIRGYDKSAKMWGPYTAYEFTTKAFSKPIITVVYSGLSHLILRAKINDSCTFQGISGFTYTMKGSDFVVHKKDGLPLNPGVSYTPSFQYKDTYGPVQNSDATTTTKKLDSTTLSVANQSIKSITDPSITPNLTFLSSGDKFEKIITVSLGGEDKTFEMELGATSLAYKTTISQVIDMVTSASTKTYTLNYNIKYYDGGYISGEETNKSVPIYLDDVLLKPPLLSASYSDSEKQQQELTALFNYSINKVTITQEAPQKLLGAPISSVSITFNGETKTLSTTDADSVTFGPYRDPISKLGAAFTMRDSRGLASQETIPVSIVDYTPPALSIGSAARENGFGTAIDINNISMVFTKTKIGGLDNTITAFIVRYAGSDSPNEIELEIDGTTNLKDHLELTPGIAGVYNESESKLGDGLELFESTQAYKLGFKIQDRFTADTGLEGRIDNIIISTGKPLMFWDELNRQIGVNTTTPRGQFEVDGDVYASRSYTLNGLFFEEEDIE